MQLIQQLQNFYVKEESQKMRLKKKKKIALKQPRDLVYITSENSGEKKKGEQAMDASTY